MIGRILIVPLSLCSLQNLQNITVELGHDFGESERKSVNSVGMNNLYIKNTSKVGGTVLNVPRVVAVTSNNEEYKYGEHDSATQLI